MIFEAFLLLFFFSVVFFFFFIFIMINKNGVSTRQRVCTITKHILLFFAFYCCLTLLVSHYSALDPGSVFFGQTRAYQPHYSLNRTKQSEAYIKSAWLRSKTSTFQNSSPKICVGVPSSTHERARSLRTTIGSLLQGLTSQERNSVDLKVLIAHVDPLVHPAVHEPWLSHTVDDVLFYNESLSTKEVVRIVDLEKSSEFRPEALQEKEVFDYFHALKACQESGAEYVAMLQDDVLAMDGWLHRSLAALEEVEEKNILENKAADSFAYLRLFYTETSLIWTSSDRALHIFSSLFLISFLAATLYFTRKLSPHSKIGRNITFYSAFWICGIITPLLIALYFAGGKLTMHPLHQGAVEMQESGCCSQGLIYPQNQATKLLEWFKAERHSGSVEALIDKYAGDAAKWTVVPSVLQHVGRKTPGKEEVEEDEEFSRLWNIGFEQFDAAELKRAHQDVLEREKARRSRVRWKRS